MRRYLYISLFCVTFSFGCSKSETNKSYELKFTVNGCTDQYSAKSQAEICSALKDHSKSKCNTYSYRKSAYKAQCGDDFDIGLSASRLVTNSEEQNAAYVDGLDEIILKYKNLGISLVFEQLQYPPVPGEPSYDQHLERFIPILDRLAEDFASFGLKEITVGDYTSYLSASLSLWIDIKLTEGVVRSYLQLHRERLLLQEATGVEIDGGIEVSRDSGTDQLEFFRSALSFFSQNRDDLTRASSLIKRVVISDVYSLRFFQNSLVLRRSSYQSDFKNSLTLLQQLAKLSKLGIDYTSFVNLSNEAPGLKDFAQFIEQNENGFSALKGLLGKLTIELTTGYDDNPRFYSSLNLLHLKIQDQFGFEAVNALLEIAPILRELDADLDVTGYELSREFVLATRLFLEQAPKILNLKSKILKVNFVSGKSSYSYKALYIGAASTPEELDRVLNSIK